MRLTEAWLLERGASGLFSAWWREHGQIEDIDELLHMLVKDRCYGSMYWLAKEARWTGVARSALREVHFRDGLPDRSDGPAMIVYRKDGARWLDDYCRGGRPDRPNGPAILWYDQYGTVVREEYWLNGQRVEREDVMGEEA